MNGFTSSAALNVDASSISHWIVKNVMIWCDSRWELSEALVFQYMPFYKGKVASDGHINLIVNID